MSIKIPTKELICHFFDDGVRYTVHTLELPYGDGCYLLTRCGKASKTSVGVFSEPVSLLQALRELGVDLSDKLNGGLRTWNGK